MKTFLLTSCFLFASLASAEASHPCAEIDLNKKTYKGTVISKGVEVTVGFTEVKKDDVEIVSKDRRFTKLYSMNIKKVGFTKKVDASEEESIRKIYNDFASHLGLFESGSQCFFTWIDSSDGHTEMSLYRNTNVLGRISLGGKHPHRTEEESFWTREFF